ncbi:hypothetical protein BZG25_09220 [Salinivibrio sp. ML198]|uniref:SPFH domain-containing protein n=1 Tax=unclassified Salinivibrio TaxID=2636825 RepID=UPI0009C47208|nr:MULTISPECIES: SPFH domain-containing protein [unclassified Salinivibrio]OOE77117.1 hypothetical protein BZG23_01970 [Salinivibrio sp. ML290]OOE79391.1 hypothetical protein BZG25_09220 [Salinivibrio sp. ML198]
MKTTHIIGMSVGASVLLVLASGLSAYHNLDNGERAVVRAFSGETHVEFEPGPFFNLFGTVTTYPDFMGLDFTTMPEHQARRGEGNQSQMITIGAEPLPLDTDVLDYTYAPTVKYNEGGIGWVKGNVQFALPGDEELMIALHKKYKSPQNLQTSLMLRTTEEALQFTAGLMSSQEAYMTHRTQFRTYAKDQIDNGIYATHLVEKETMGADGKKTIEELPEIVMADNKPVRADSSPIDDYGIKLTQFNIKDWDFEQKTKDQIALKRDAENAVITSKARTAEAEQARLEAIALAARDKARAKGKAEVVKAREVVNAERRKQLAIINAQQNVEVAKQIEKQREAELRAATLEAKALEVSSKAEAEAADRKIKAGGQLSAEQQTRIQIAERLAKGFADAQRPSTVVLSGSSSGDASALTGSSMDSFLDAMTAANAKAMGN